MFDEGFNPQSLPPTLHQASISLLLKKGKDPHNCSSYRPISLLNVDVKILAKVLALCLESVLPTIVSSDQTGFIKSRHLFFNIRHVFNILYTSPSSQHPEVFLALDAEKAFDRVEWKYLFNVLCKPFGFGSSFISWVKLLYNPPLASVRTNDHFSSYFPLQRGTRQGCPLSPLFFALVMEPLATIRQCTDIKGIFRALTSLIAGNENLYQLVIFSDIYKSGILYRITLFNFPHRHQKHHLIQSF